MRERRILCLAVLSGMLWLQPVLGHSRQLVSDGTTSVSVEKSGPSVSLNLKNVPVKQLFDAIHKQTGLDFLYSTEHLASMPRVTVTVENEPVESVLAKVFRNTGITFKVEGKLVTITKREEENASTQNRKVRGTILDKDGYPVIGAAVMIKGTHIGVMTDMDGKYELEAKPGDVLHFSFLGMEPVEITYNGARQLDLRMNESATVMQDVVVTGIFQKAKESYTGSVSTITKDELQMYRGQNLLQTLKNADASLNFAVNNVVGSNPNSLPSITIRGNSSLPTSLQEYNEDANNDSNTPLIILDGFEISLERLMDYNDEEIENINILKDAAATAIYGSKGANGVIVVTTKQPEAGRLRVSAEIGTDIEAPDLTSYNLLNAADKLALEYAAGLYDSDDPEFDLEYKEVYYERLRNVLSGVDTDWLSKPLRTGVGTHYNIRLEGGSEEFRWSATSSYKDVQGAMKGSTRKTFNGAIQLLYKVKDFTFKNYTSYAQSRGHESPYGDFSDYAAQQPYNAPYDTDGNVVRYFDGFYSTSSKTQNPLYDATLGSFDKSGYQTLTNNFAVEWTPLKSIILRAQLGVSSTDDTSDVFLSANSSTYMDYDTDSDEYLNRGSYTYTTGRSTTWSGNFTAAYTETFAEKHQLYAGIYGSLEETTGRSYAIEAVGLSDDDLSSLISARQYAEDEAPTGSLTRTRTLGLTANLNYIYNNRYYADFSFRVDGSSSFGSDKKYAPFWSAGIGWNIHNERFMKNTPFNTLRLKMSYGTTGTMTGSDTGAKTTYSVVTDNRYMSWTGSTLNGWGNPELTWQTTKEFNIGTEFALWNGRIKGEFEVYYKNTDNLLSYLDIPQSMGFSSYLANIGAVKNRGWELSLSTYLIRDSKHDLIWMLGGQLVHEKSWISKLSDAIKTQTAARLLEGDEVDNLLYEGYSQNAIYAVRSLGVDPSTGQEVFLDADGNITDVWNAADKVYCGTTDPSYRGNLNTMLKWKGFTLNLQFSYYWGGQVYNSTLIDKVEVTLSDLREGNVDSRVYTDRWMTAGDVTSFKALGDTETKASSRFVMDDNVLELSSLSLQYRWDSDWIKRKMNVSSITFGVNMSDLWEWTSVKMERGTSYPYARNIQGSIKFLF